MRTIGSICLWGVVFISGFSISSLFAKPSAHYPQLQEQKAATENYEIVKLIDGPIDSVYSNVSSGEFIGQSGSKLWKINTKGEVIDYFDEDGLYTSGLIIKKEGVIDWVFTGDKQLKPYTKTIDAKAYSQKELFDAFDQADIIEFDEVDESTSFAYLYKQGQAWILDISTQGKKIDDFYITQRVKKDHNLRRDETDINASNFENYQKKNQNLQFLSSFEKKSSASWQMKSIGFEKEFTHRPHSILGTFFENLARAIFTSRSRQEYGYPAGYIKYELLNAHESIKFSIFADIEYDKPWAHNFSWLGRESENPDALTFITINYRRTNLTELNELSLLPYYEKDVGLYVLRKKTVHNKNNFAAWQLSYSGLHSYDSIWGHTHFAQDALPPVYYWFWQSRPIPEDRQYFWPGRWAQIACPVLKTLPESMTFHWTDFKANRSFRLVVNERDAFFYDKDDTKVSITLKFDAAELTRAFQQLSKSTDLIQLNLHMEEKPRGAELLIHLQDSKQRTPLKKVQIDYQEIPYTPKSPDSIQDSHHTTLFLAYENSLISFNPDFFLKNLQLLIDRNEIPTYASSISYYFARLSYEFNINQKFDENLQLTNFYLNNIHALIKNNRTYALQHQNLAVFASQGIYLGSNTRNKDLNNRIINTFVEQDFDLEQETNRVFLFNVACQYAVNHNKPQMLKMIRRAVELGKMAEDFLKDPDFTDYWQDPDFLAAVGKQ